jgi:uncharacterized protein YggU (UPF0235/DUF167 family)
LLHVRLTPRGGRDSLDGVATGDDGRAVLLARVRALPTEGEANAALIALIAKALGVQKSAVTLASGGKSRTKTLRIAGGAEVEVRLVQICGA